MVRGIEVQPDDVAHLLDEKRVGGQLERALPVRLDPKQRKPPLHRALRDAVCAAMERALQCVRSGGGICRAWLMTVATRSSS